MALKPVPLIIIIGTGITGGVGAVAGAVGGVRINRARTQIRHHATRYERRHADHLARVEPSKRSTAVARANTGTSPARRHLPDARLS